MATTLPYGVHRSYAIIYDPDAPSGIGMEAGSAPRVRFFARTEITVFEIGPKR